MDKPFLNIIFLILNSLVLGQNLVPNGSFEEYDWCPDYTNGFYIEAAKHWNNPTMGTSDYFNSCSTYYDSILQRFMFSVPQNYAGEQNARTGSAYAGFSYTQGNDPSVFWLDQIYSEYMQIELNQELTAGNFYELQFYVSNAFTNICGNSIGALLVDTEMNEPHQTIIQQDPQVQSDLNVFFCDSTKWFEIKQTFQALGGEKFLIIGVFTPLYKMQTSDYNGNIISGPGQYGANEYLYIDDVLLIETSVELPNIFTPNNDGINDIAFKNSLLKEFKVDILNRWGGVVNKVNLSEGWDGRTMDGKEAAEGVYFFVIRLENTKQEFIKTGFIQLVR